MVSLTHLTILFLSTWYLKEWPFVYNFCNFPDALKKIQIWSRLLRSGSTCNNLFVTIYLTYLYDVPISGESVSKSESVYSLICGTILITVIVSITIFLRFWLRGKYFYWSVYYHWKTMHISLIDIIIIIALKSVNDFDLVERE